VSRTPTHSPWPPPQFALPSPAELERLSWPDANKRQAHLFDEPPETQPERLHRVAGTERNTGRRP
jgi:hypothetical protein